MKLSPSTSLLHCSAGSTTRLSSSGPLVAVHIGDDGVSGFRIGNRPELPLVYYFDHHEGIAWSRDLSAEDELRAAYALVRSSLTEAALPKGPTGREGPRASSVWLP